MARTRKTRTVQPRRSTTLVRLEHCEDRLPFGSLFAMPGVPLAELSFGQLSGMLQTAPSPHINYLHGDPAPFALIDPPAATSTTFGEPLANLPSAYSVGVPSVPGAPSPITAPALVPLDLAFADSLGAAAWAADPLRGFDVFSSPHSPLKQPAGADSAAEGASVARPGDVGGGFVPGGSTEGVSAGASQPWPQAEAAGLHQAVLEAMASPRRLDGPTSEPPKNDPPGIQQVNCPNHGNGYLTTVTVLANSANFTYADEPLLVGYTAYTLIATGTASINGAGVLADAEYYDFSGGPIEPNVRLVAGGDLLPEKPPVEPFWGKYRTSHKYYGGVVTDSVPPGEQVRIGFHFEDPDGNSNNTGEFTVEIWCAGKEAPQVDGCDCGAADLVGNPRSMSSGSPGSYSSGPVQYQYGMPKISSTDLSSGGFGTAWGVTRTFASDPGFAPDGFAGDGTVISQLPYVLNYGGDPANPNVGVVSNGTTSRGFDWVTSAYVPRRYGQEKLTHSATNKEFVLTDPQGNTLKFNNFDSSLRAYERGQLKSYTDPFGFTTTVVRPPAPNLPAPDPYEGKVTEVWRQTGSGSSTVLDSYQFTYYAGTLNKGMLQKVRLRRGTGSPLVYETVRDVEYSYYLPDGLTAGATQYHGPMGTLKLAQIKDANGLVIDTEYYRYYKAAEANGYTGGLKYVFRNASYQRMAAGLAALNKHPLTALDSEVAPYADLFFKYDAQHRVTEEKVQGLGCSQCSEGQGTLRYTYSIPSVDPGSGDLYNKWYSKTVEEHLDSAGAVQVKKIVYTNYYGQVMLTDTHSPADTSTRWVHYYRYFFNTDVINYREVNGKVILHAPPSAIEKVSNNYYSEGQPGLVTSPYLKDDAGLIETTTYHEQTTATSTTAGGVKGYLNETFVQRGELGTPVRQSTSDYFSHTAHAANGGAVIYVPANDKVYRNAGDPDPNAIKTSYTYTWQVNPSDSGQETNQIATRTVSKPIVTATQNGPGTAATETTTYDSFGRATSFTDADAKITTTTYDQGTGAVKQTVVDSGGLNLTTDYVLDTQGRTKTTSVLNGNTTHTVYLDGARDEVQFVELTGPPTGGTFTLAFAGSAPTNPAIDYNAPAATVQQRLEALGSIGAGNVTATAVAGGWQVRFSGALAGQEVPALVADGAGLINGSVQLTTLTAGGGPVNQVRTYPGWDTTSTGCSAAAPCTTGPIQVSRENPTLSYTESLAISGLPAVDPSTHLPTGAEPITTNVKTLSRTHTNKSSQVIKQDRYYNLTGLTYTEDVNFGSLGTNFYQTTQAYDKRGRQDKAVTANGTITRTEFDVMSRPIFTWIGTDDTNWPPPTTSACASPCNMKLVGARVYDGTDALGGTAGVGDGNLTQQIAYPTPKQYHNQSEPADRRVSRSWYDFRNRQVASKSGVESTETDTVNRPLLASTLDNLSQVIMQEQYDGDTMTSPPTPITNACDRQPTPAQEPNFARRRSCATSAFDEQGRVYRTNTYNIQQTTGLVVTFGTNPVTVSQLQSDTWYNKRGQVLKTLQPGGLVTKTEYDGAGRSTRRFSTDGGGDTSWADAGTVTGDSVLTQSETVYDANGNVIQTTQRERFHDETLTDQLCDPAGTGAPCTQQNPGAKARVSNSGTYYDRANRVTHSVNVGTNNTGSGGGNWTRPATPPADSDTVLITRYGYQADEVQTVALTGSPVGGTFTLTFCIPQGGGPPACQTTPSAPGIPWNATLTDVRTALENLSNLGVGNVYVAGHSGTPTTAGGPWIVRFVNAKGETDQLEMTATSNLTGGGVTVSTGSQGGDAGHLQKVTDPRGQLGNYSTRTDYDLLGRTVRTVEGYTNFVPTASTNRTTEYTYDGSNHVVKVKAVLPDAAPPNPVQQTTQYVYSTSTWGGSAIESNDLLVIVGHPHKTTGVPDLGDSSLIETYQYNAVGQERYARFDRNGTVHAYSYDVVGRMVSDVVTVGPDVDSTLRQLTTAYDTAGRPYLFTSYDVPGNIVNQVQRDYNGLGQLVTEYQSHSGAVNTGSTPNVQYVYSEANNGSNQYANHSRLKSLVYPDRTLDVNGRAVNYKYGTVPNDLNDTLSRLTSITNSSTTYEQYAYLGLGSVVKRTRVQGQTEIGLTYVKQSGETNGDAGDPYTGLDRFGRIVDQRWLDQGAPTNPLVRFQYGYDRNSNRLYRENLSGTSPNHSFDELYHIDGANAGYDNFNQLLGFARGSLNGAKDSIATLGYYQKWMNGATWTTGNTESTLDVQGNWTSVNTNGTIQPREHNQQNQATRVGAANPDYTNNGEMKLDETGKTLLYDAWERLVQVKQGQTVLATYRYDALNRRVTETDNGPAKDFYYSDQWQLLEERHGGVVKMQYVWSPVYVDAMILRDRDTGGASDLDERRYVLQDANWNVVAVTEPSGNVLERYVYEPYGKHTRLTSGWGTPGSDTINWVYLHQGGRYEAATGLYHFRNRELSPTLGRWNRQDPMGFGAGDSNLYRYLRNLPTGSLDPYGLVSGDFEGGRTDFEGLAYIDRLVFDIGNTRIASLMPGAAATFHSTQSLMDISNEEKTRDGSVRLVSGMKVLIDATVKDKKETKCYYWYQQVWQVSNGKKTDNLPNDKAWQDDGGKVYPNQKYGDGTVTMTDSPGFGFGFSQQPFLHGVMRFDADRKGYWFQPVEQEVYDILVKRFRDHHGENETEVEFNFRTRLMYKKPEDKGDGTVKGYWDWGFTVSVPKVKGAYKTKVEPMQARWSKGKS